MLEVQELEQKLGTHADLVDIEATKTCFIIRMKRREDKDTWQAIADCIKGLGGKWVYGKDSHGEIPFAELGTKEITLTDVTQLQFVLDFEELLKQGYRKLTVKWEK